MTRVEGPDHLFYDVPDYLCVIMAEKNVGLFSAEFFEILRELNVQDTIFESEMGEKPEPSD